MRSTEAATRVFTTRIPDSSSWMRRDALSRLLPFAAVCVVVELVWRPSWMGFGGGRVGVQLWFGLVAAPLLFIAATWVQRELTRRRRTIFVPAGPGDAAFQAGYYALNAPIEEAFFRGLVQGGLGALT